MESYGFSFIVLRHVGETDGDNSMVSSANNRDVILTWSLSSPPADLQQEVDEIWTVTETEAQVREVAARLFLCSVPLDSNFEARGTSSSSVILIIHRVYVLD